jgi:hypothetical protein
MSNYEKLMQALVSEQKAAYFGRESKFRGSTRYGGAHL